MFDGKIYVLYRNDAEIISYALDTFYHVMSNEPTDEGKHSIN